MKFYRSNLIDRPALDSFIADLIAKQVEPVFDYATVVTPGLVAGLVELKSGTKGVKVHAVAASLVRLGWTPLKIGQKSLHLNVTKKRRSPKGFLIEVRSRVTPLVAPRMLEVLYLDQNGQLLLKRIQNEVNGLYSETSEWWKLEGDPLDRI